MSRQIAEKAWNKVKDKDDPEFAASAPDHQRNLEAMAADAIRTGVTVNEFERAVVELSRKEAKDAPKTALGTSEPTALGTSEPKAKAAEAPKEPAPKEESKPAVKTEAKSDKGDK